MERPFGAKASRSKQFIQKPGFPTNQAPVTDEDTLSLGAVHSSPPVGIHQSKQFMQNPDFPTNQTPVIDEDTVPLGTVHSSPYVGVPNTPKPNQYTRNIVDQASIADQRAAPLASVYDHRPAPTPEKKGKNPPGVIRRRLLAWLARLQEPQPEGLLTRGLQAVKPGTGLGPAPFLAVTNAFGLLLVSISYYISVLGYSYPIVETSCFAGLLMMVVPNLVRVLSRAPSRLERIVVLCVLAGCCYFVQFMTSPLHFSGFDEFLHWRTADDILRTGHLFSENSMLPASPYFPGLEIVTNAVSTLSGLSTFCAGNIVIATARLLMVLSLFLFYEHITSSSRMASIAVIIYMANPHFLFFDDIYNYETLSLPLATLMMYILARYGNANKNHRGVIGSAWIVLGAIAITHHMTSYVLDGLLILWAGVSFFQPVPRNTRIYLTVTAIFGVLLSLAYALLLPHNPVWSYLSEYFGGAFNQLEQIVTGSNVARPLFTSSVIVAPIWDKLIMTGTIALVTFLLPFGLLIVQRQYRDNALAITFGIASLLYPLTQAFRFTSFGTEITDRSAAFLFLPIAYLLTVLITHFWSTRRLNRRAISLITSIIVVIFMGGVIVGSGPELIDAPGPYIVVADGRSVEPEGIEDAIWSLAYLGQDNRIATDRINQMLMNAYGHQRVITRLDDHVDVSPVFYSAQFDNADIAIVREGQIHYLAVDTRISTAFPLVETYFENDRPSSIIRRDALTKFNTVTQIDRLFDSGDIVIYNTRAFIGESIH